MTIAALGALGLGLAGCAAYPSYSVYGDGMYSYNAPAYTYSYPRAYAYTGYPSEAVNAESPELGVPANYTFGTTGPSVSTPGYLGGGTGSNAGASSGSAGTTR